MNLYDPKLLRLATRIGHTDPINGANVTVHNRSRVCGSHMAAKAKIEHGAITALNWEVQLCAVGQAVAGALTPHVIGMTADQLASITGAFRKMVETGEVDFPDQFTELETLKVVHEHPSRHSSVMLPFECLECLFEEADKLETVN